MKITKIVFEGDCIKKYWDDDSVSQSKLKTYAKSIHERLQDKKEKDSSHFLLGSLTEYFWQNESFLRDVHNRREDYKSKYPTFTDYFTFDKFLILPDDFPSFTPSEKTVIEYINDNFTLKEIISNWDSLIESENVLNNCFTSLKKETVIKKLSEKKYRDYILLQKTVSDLDLEIVYPEIFYKSCELATILLNQEDKIKVLLEEGKKYIWYYQTPVYSNILGEKAKGLVDLLICELDEKDEIVKMLPFDLKTTGDFVSNFPKSVSKFRYDIQASWYSALIREPFSFFPSEFKKINYSKLVVENFRFIVISTLPKSFTFSIFEVTTELELKGFFGDSYSLGINSLMSVYKFESNPENRNKDYFEIIHDKSVIPLYATNKQNI